jgi:hypothetical protein
VALAVVALVLAIGAFVVAADLRAWDADLRRGDARFATAPVRARWSSHHRLPKAPVERLLSVRDDLALRRAVQAFVVAARTPRGFDNGDRQRRARAAAEAALADVAADAPRAAASQAENLLGVLVFTGGRVAGGATADERSQAAFVAAVRLDPTNAAAKFNLELVLRRQRATGTRTGPNAGTGTRGSARRGAGAGTPGRGY